uniref:Uncharacterized protein n=1 Tax=Spongospora subterranea TaxID=70186 RepID=A0A0H5QGK0_9EUKA|eukprot:CRZ01158.1 hypothetical protein [Spongospora subterranea]
MNCCDYGPLQSCYNRRLDKMGAVYGDRDVPHVQYIDPRFHKVPKSDRWIRGGFDQYRKSEFNGQTWIYGEWAEENFWRQGDFVLHSYDKSQMAQFVPKEFGDSCQSVLNMVLPPGVEHLS